MTAFDLLTGAASLKDLSDVEALLSLQRPTIVHIPGQDRTHAILISVLLHGCEPAGFRAMLREFNSNTTPYAMDVYFLIGNVESAQIPPYFTNRLVPGKENYNRIWVKENSGSEGENLAAEIFSFLESLPLIAHLDLHSFTAKDTPPHAMVSNRQGLHLTRKFTENTFIIDTPIGALIELTSRFGPSCVVECGTNGSPEADDFAYETLQKFFKECKVKPGANEQIGTGIFDTMTNIKVNPDVSVSWADTEQLKTELTLRQDVSLLNLQRLPPGEFLGWADSLNVFTVKMNGNEVEPTEVFRIENGRIYTKFPCVPNLMAPSEKIAKESGFYFFKPASV